MNLSTSYYIGRSKPFSSCLRMFLKLNSVKSRISCLGSACLLVFIFSCNNDRGKTVDKTFIDSLIGHYALPPAIKANEDEMQFWKSRINPGLPGLVNESKYASTLITRFQQFGDIRDVKMADSIMRKVSAEFNDKEPGPLLALVRYSILQHRFTEANAFLQKAHAAGLKKYESLTTSFDVDFEMGRYANAALAVRQLQPEADYGYYFRKSKMEHFHGKMDSAIQSMLKAAQLAESSAYLKGVALSNAADLYIHAGELKKAKELYVQCIKINSADYHSILGLGWIALVYDKNDSLAEQLFRFVDTKNKLPEAVFKLYQMAQGRGDSILASSYAKRFVARATDTVYGNMYNKYLIEMYTGLLHEPAKAQALAKKELENRATPQTYAWYAWSLFSNNNVTEAYKTFEMNVSARPLEGLELYWMGKLMQGLGKGYNAQAFFKEAYKNYYDLSPAIEMDLGKSLL